jgi:hypothetical protein
MNGSEIQMDGHYSRSTVDQKCDAEVLEDPTPVRVWTTERQKESAFLVAKGAGRIRTATEGYAGLPLSTWVRRHFKNTGDRKTTNRRSNGLSKL